MLFVQSGALVYGDAPAGGGGAGLSVVRVATTADITLSGTQTIDGVALSVDDPVLVKNQSTPSQNGAYLVKSGAWVPTAWDAADITVVVAEGTVNGGLIFTNASNITKLSQSLPASAITSGEFEVARIPSLPASKLTSGTFEVDRIQWNGGVIGANYVGPTTNWPAAGGVQPLVETFPAWNNPTSLSQSGMSNKLLLVGIVLPKGLPVNAIGFSNGATALASGGQQWFSLWDDAFACLGVTVNDTSAAWAAGAYKVLDLSGGTYTVPTTKLYYLGINIVAGTYPTLRGIANTVNTTIPNRVRSFTADTNLGGPVAVGYVATPTAFHTMIPWGFVA